MTSIMVGDINYLRHPGQGLPRRLASFHNSYAYNMAMWSLSDPAANLRSGGLVGSTNVSRRDMLMISKKKIPIDFLSNTQQI